MFSFNFLSRATLIAALLLSAGAAFAQSATVDSFTPQGEVRRIQQVAIRFSADMVRLGEGDAAAPITVTCPQGTSDPGKGRWLDTRRYVVEWPRDLPIGTRCIATLRAGVKTLDGRAVAATGPWEFTTGGPKLAETRPYQGQSIKEHDIFLLRPDAQPDPASVDRYLQCQAEGEAPMRVERLSREEGLRAMLVHNSNFQTRYWDEQWWMAYRCARPFANNAKVRLIWSAGIAAMSGVGSRVDQILNYVVRPPFTLNVTCGVLEGVPGCDPRSGLTFQFSYPMAPEEIDKISITAEGGKRIALTPVNRDARHSYAYSEPLALFDGGGKVSVQLASMVRDIDGRTLTNFRDFPKTISVPKLPPYVGFVQSGAVLSRISESGKPAQLVVAARFVERQLTAKAVRIGGELGETGEKTAIALLRTPQNWPQQDRGVTYPVLAQQSGGIPYPVFANHATPLPKPIDLSLATNGGAMAFYGLPLDKPGLWLVEIDSATFRAARSEAQRPPAQRARVVQVSDLNITARAGTQGNSLIWVTHFSDARPVADADIAVYDCNDALVWRGKSGRDGTASVALGASCSSQYRSGHIAVVRQGEDMALLQIHSGYNPRQNIGTTVGHTILDRTLLKAGETLHLENHTRLQTAEGFRHLSPRRGTLEIRFNFNEIVHKGEIEWNEHGAAHSTWRIPANAKLGRYFARITDSTSGMTYDTQFQVEEFRAPVFDAKLSGAPVWRSATEQTLPVETSLSYLAGGAAAGERVSLQGRWNMSATAPVAGFEFTDRTLPPFPTQNEASRDLTLDDKGLARTTLTPPKAQHAITLLAEMRFSDPNGEVQTIAQRFAVWPYPGKVGVRATVKPGDTGTRTVELAGVVLDAADKPAAGKTLQFTVARARAQGNIQTRIGEESPACQAVTDAQGQARCDWQPGAAANTGSNEFWLVTARPEGEQHTATTSINDWQLRWVPSNAVLEIENYNAQDNNAALAPNETARLRVRAPFTPATLLLTIEREGVLTHGVHAITDAETRIPLELKGHYAPNVQISASFVRPIAAARGDNPEAQGPLQTSAQHAMQLRVRPAAYTLTVSVKPQREEARVRERVPVVVSVRTLQGQPAAGAHVTLIAVDDALLALRPNTTWNLFVAMTRQRNVALMHYTLAAQLAREIALGPQRAYRPWDEGLRQAESVADATAAGGASNALMQRAFAAPAPAMKPAAAPPPPPGAGGAGGAAEPAVRSDFSTLALWQTSIVTDASGNATVEVPLNDSLTRWRIVAIATHNADRFGTGEATLRTVQPLQVVSGLPLSVRSGDALTQKITLRNTTQQSVTVDVTARAQLTMSDGVRDTPPADAARGLLLTRKVTLKPQQNQEVTWPVSVPDNVDRLKWSISAKSGDLGDAIEIEQVVTPAVPVTVRQAMLLQIEKSTTVPVAQPAGARTNAGGVSVDWKASLGDAALTEVRKWMRAYPFICLEQKTSKLAALADRDGWDALMRELPKYLDGNGLARYFPTTQLPGSEILTAYVLDTAAALKWPIPAAEKSRMVNALRNQLAGRAQALDWAPQDVSVARALALQATVIEQEPARALERIVTPQDMSALPTTALVDWIRYLLASPKDATRGDTLKEAAATLRSRYDVQGARLNWRNEARENWWWFMWNGNVAAARTAWVVNRWSIEDPSWKDELPLLVTGLVGRQQQGHWGTTTANVWGSIALADFARAREATPVSGTSTMRMGTQSATVTWPGAASTALGWSAAQDTLTLNHSGSGAPWATVAVRAAVKLDKPVAQGLSVARTVTPVEQKIAGQWSVGDVARVTLTMSSSAALTWVVVRDPVPSGASILGRGLARESTLAQQGQQRAGAWPVFEERAAESYRGYYRYIPQGPWSVEYTVRLNNAGTFEFPPTRVEAMYAPEIFGETPIAPLVVQP